MTRPLLFYIQVASTTDIRFGHPFKHLKDQVILFECDNHSDENMLRYARQLAEEAKKLFVYLDIGSEQEKLGVVRPFLTSLLQSGSKAITIVCSGSHPMIDKMASPLGIIKVEDEAAAWRRAAEWLGSGI